MDATLEERIVYVKHLLAHGRHAAMATVNADGTPHNSPFYFAADQHLENLYFNSAPTSRHVQNVLRTGELFVVMYDLMRGGGLYLEARQGHELFGVELEQGLEAFNASRKRDKRSLLSLEDYRDPKGPQRLYGAHITKFWVNLAERNENGEVIADRRYEVQRQDLIQ